VWQAEKQKVSGCDNHKHYILEKVLDYTRKLLQFYKKKYKLLVLAYEVQLCFGFTSYTSNIISILSECHVS
jgi:hypothetical protein